MWPSWGWFVLGGGVLLCWILREPDPQTLQPTLGGGRK